jgi:hypothetical protein
MLNDFANHPTPQIYFAQILDRSVNQDKKGNDFEVIRLPRNQNLDEKIKLPRKEFSEAEFNQFIICLSNHVEKINSDFEVLRKCGFSEDELVIFWDCKTDEIQYVPYFFFSEHNPSENK